MSNKPSEELDKLFQQEPDQYPFEYNPNSWSKMEDLLDEDDRRRVIWWWLLGLGLAVVAIFIWFWTNTNTDLTSTEVGIEKKISPEDLDKVSEKEIIKEIGNNDLEQNSTQSTSTQNQTNLNNNEIDGSNSKSIQNQIKSKSQDLSNSNASQPKEYLSKSNTSSVNKEAKLPFLQSPGSDNFAIVDSTTKELESTSETLTNSRSNSPLPFDKDEFLGDLELASIDPLMLLLLDKDLDSVFVITDTIIYIPPPPDESKGDHMFFVGALLGGEVSKTINGSTEKPSLKLGAYFDYRFNKYWGISAGANFVRKDYGALGSEYWPPSGFWDSGGPPSTVDATCDILELPISISYFPDENNQDGFFANAGISSIFMLNERYDYTYSNVLPDQRQYWMGSNKSRHWLSIGEISIGYQKFLSERTSIQVAPYLQIPIKGIGHGLVKLWSFGINGKFSFELKKKQD